MNYLLPNGGKELEEEIIDLEILENLSEKYYLPIEELKEMSSQQISDLIETGDYNFSKDIEKEILNSLNI